MLIYGQPVQINPAFMRGATPPEDLSPVPLYPCPCPCSCPYPYPYPYLYP